MKNFRGYKQSKLPKSFDILDLSANFAGVLVAYYLIKIYKSRCRL